MTQQDDSDPSEAESLFASYLARCERAAAAGEPALDFEAWVADHPHHEPELRRLESDWRGFDALLEGALGREGGEPLSLFHRGPAAGPDSDSTQRASFVEFEPGKTVGEYELVRRIGQGGMGEVWEARQASLDRAVALKFIRPDRLTERSEAYFDREARAGGRLNHPGIVAVHATGRNGDLHWIAQELVPGSSTLKDFLRGVDQGAAVPTDYFERVARFVAELCDALQVAHEAGVIHRDIKPHNVLITAEDRPKLTDFGLARLTDEAAFSGSYALKGTPVYMSPEQLLGKTRLIDHRTDLFSTGAVLFELLTLRRPFEGDSEEVMARILTSEAPDPRGLRADVPAELGAIALRALERRPSDRYPSAEAMADDLRRYLANEPVLARPPGPVRRAAKWVRRHPTLTSAVLLGTLLGGTAYLLSDRAAEASEGRELAERDVLLTNVLRAVEAGDVAGAEAHAERFGTLYPDDARGPLTMALGYWRTMHLDVVDDALRGYAAHGLEAPPPSGAGPAMDALYAGLHWQAQEGMRHPKVLESLRRAVELDPELEYAYYPLYQASLLEGREEEARAALVDFRGVLRTGDPTVIFVDGLLARLDGELVLAADTLEQVRAAQGDSWFERLKGFTDLGTIYLELYQAEPERHFEALNRAEGSLRKAVEANAEDAPTWANLGLIHLRKHDRTPNQDQRRERLEQALACSRASLEIDARNLSALQVQVMALHNLAEVEPSPPRRAGYRERLESSLAELEVQSPEDRLAASVRSDLWYQRGLALRASDREAAIEAFRKSAAEYDLQLPGRVLLGQELFLAREFSKAYAVLRDCVPIDAELVRRGADHPLRWRFSLRVWLAGTADHAGELDAAFVWLEQAREMAEEGGELGLEELFTLAEFAALPAQEELRDCELARWLFEAFPLEETFAASQGALLADIRDACAD